MTTSETLKAARKLVADERDWYQAPIENSLGRKRVDGRVVRCMGAAICEAGAPWPSRQEVWEAVQSVTAPEAIYEFNFTHTHAEVLAAFDEAISKVDATKEGK